MKYSPGERERVIWELKWPPESSSSAISALVVLSKQTQVSKAEEDRSMVNAVAVEKLDKSNFQRSAGVPKLQFPGGAEAERIPITVWPGQMTPWGARSAAGSFNGISAETPHFWAVKVPGLLLGRMNHCPVKG